MNKRLIIILLVLFAIAVVVAVILYVRKSRGVADESTTVFTEVSYPTPNIGEGTNDLQGIVLHHTAEPTINSSLSILTSVKAQVSCHAVIDTDGTRYILADPTAITWHAGYSVLNGRERCNEFTLGIEFQGDTTQWPLTEEQINSAIEYILPIMEKYHIPKENIVTHEKVRMDWMTLHPELVAEKHVSTKQDLTKEEYKHFMEIFNERVK